MSSRKEQEVIPANSQVAVVFPGQGAQRAGMGADLYERFDVARRTLEEASDAVGLDIAKLSFGDDPRLDQTEVTQPCLLAIEYAGYRVAVEEYGLDAVFFGGHSLGEYTALLAGGVIPLAEAMELVHARGKLMQEAVAPGEGGMAALILEAIEASGAIEIVTALGAEVANHNSPSQIAVSGTVTDLDRVRSALAEALPSLDYVPLKVSVPFHSRFMRPVVDRLFARLEACQRRFRPSLASHVTSNLTGCFHDPERLVRSLAEQVAAPVRWRDNMSALAGRAPRIFEIGPRGSLSKFLRASGFQATPLSSAGDFETQLSARRGIARPATSRMDAQASSSISTSSAERASSNSAAEPRYLIGGMGRGIGSAALVIKAGEAGLLAFLGSSGLPLATVERELVRVRSALPGGAPWGLNITLDITDPGRADDLFDLAVRHGVPALELAGFRAPTAGLVRARLVGLQRTSNGRPRPARRVLVKLSDESVARRFLAPPPPGLVPAALLEQGVADAAGTIALADDLCAAPVWGEDPSFPAQLLLPILADLVREHIASGAVGSKVRVGLAGGLGSPEALAAAFAAGADFVLTGSVNQCTLEAGISDEAKALLAAAELGDFSLAPDAERFELGGRVQVLRRGLTFAARAERLELLWRSHGSLAKMPAEERRRFVALCRRFVEPSVTEAIESPAATAALVRQWLEATLVRAIRGDSDAAEDLQIQSGPAIAAFNRAVRGSRLADWRRRHVDEVGRFLLDGADGLLASRTSA